MSSAQGVHFFKLDSSLSRKSSWNSSLIICWLTRACPTPKVEIEFHKFSILELDSGSVIIKPPIQAQLNSHSLNQI